MTRDGAPERGDLPLPSDLPAGWSVLKHLRTRAIRHPRPASPPRRERGRMDLPPAPQATRPAHCERPTAAIPPPWAGGASAASWWMGALFGIGSICFALGSVPALLRPHPTGGRRRDVLRRVLVLHQRRRLAVLRNTKRTDRDRTRLGRAPRMAVAARREPQPNRLVGGDRAARRHGLLQHHHLRGHAYRSHFGSGAPPDLGARLLRLDLLPCCQLARLLRGQPRRPAPLRRLDRVVDSRGQSGSAGGVRCRRDRVPVPPHDRRDRQHRTRQRSAPSPARSASSRGAVLLPVESARETTELS